MTAGRGVSGAHGEVVLAVLASTALAGVLSVLLPPGAAFVTRCVLLALLGAVVLLGWRRARGEAGGLGPASRVTLARAALMVPVAGMVGEPHAASVAATAGALAGASAVLDGVDGALARRTATVSAFGARFDMETDALLILVLCVLAWQWGKAGPWILLAGLARYAFVFAARVLPWLRRELPASARRRAVCASTTGALVACVLPAVPPAASTPLAAAALAALASSFAIDIHWLLHRARAAPRGGYAHGNS